MNGRCKAARKFVRAYTLKPPRRRLTGRVCHGIDCGDGPRHTRRGHSMPLKVEMPHYDCSKCPGYCCSYPLIALDKRDVDRLARHHGMGFDEAQRAFTRTAHGRKYALRRKKDTIYGRICRFFDTKARRCTVYEARPAVCRSFPGEGRCGYYDFLKFERRAQDDPEFVALTDHSDP